MHAPHHFVAVDFFPSATHETFWESKIYDKQLLQQGQLAHEQNDLAASILTLSLIYWRQDLTQLSLTYLYKQGLLCLQVF